MNEKFVKLHKLKVIANTDDDIDLTAAEGNSIQVSGTTELCLQAPGGNFTKCLALVCPKLSNELLLSWSSQKKLRMLHRNWPFQVLGQEQASTANIKYTIPQRFKKRVDKKPLHTPV